MNDRIILSLHVAKNLAQIISRMRRRAIDQARDAEFVFEMFNKANSFEVEK